MNEYSLIFLAIGGLLGVVIASLLYALGGRKGKWKRRYVGSFILALTANLIAVFAKVWIWQFILVYPALILAFSMGYGGDTTSKKIIRRTIFAIWVVCAGLVFTLSVGGNKLWLIFICQALCGGSSIILGVKNPLPAAVEEVVICMALTFFIPIYPLALVG